MRRVFTIATVAGISTVVLAPAAVATNGHGWQPYRTQPFTTPGVCAFTMQGDIVRDEEEVRTDATFPDGSPRIQMFRGPLIIRFTNLSNGRSVVRELSSTGRMEYRPDGTTMLYSYGDGATSVRIFIGNATTPAGWYIPYGRFRLTIHPDGTRDLMPIHSEVENLCRTLA
jgi:hypothetical protein